MCDGVCADDWRACLVDIALASLRCGALRDARRALGWERCEGEGGAVLNTGEGWEVKACNVAARLVSSRIKRPRLMHLK